MPKRKYRGKSPTKLKKRRKVYYGISAIVLAALVVGMLCLIMRAPGTPLGTNNPPSTPSAPSGSTSGAAGSAYTYTISNTDPDGDQVKYTFDWGDGTTTDTGYVDSGSSAGVSHAWPTLGTYTVKVLTTDNNGATSSWSEVLTVTIAVAGNNPPAAPSAPFGSTSGTTGVSYTYSVSATDSDGDKVKYTFDWGDNTTTETSLVASGASSSARHTWSSAGTYSVKAMTTDNKGATSSWSTALTVTITGAGTDSSRYNFEVSAQGWTHQTWTDSQAITSIIRTTSLSKLGSGSIKCTVNLIGGHANNSKGEAWVDMRNDPPQGVAVPTNLSNATVTVWVYLPAEAVGDNSRPNGIQIFFKDSGWASKYSSWNNIGTDLPTGQWSQVTVNTATENWAYEGGCNMSDVISVGVKIGAGTGSTENFSGYIYIDAFNW